MAGDDRHDPHAVAVAFPGQGGDWKAACRTLTDRAGHPLVAALADRLGTDRWADLDGLDTRNAQPIVYTAGLVGPAPTCTDGVVAAVGHSLGEITAAAWAGAIDPEAGLDLVVTRAALGHESHARRPGAMAAFMRWDEARIEWLRRGVLAELDGVLEVAVTNSPTQIVLSGDARLVDEAVRRANDAGAVARHLPIGGAYHSPLMVAEIEPFRTAVAAAVTSAPAVPIVSSTAARAVTDADDLAETITRSLVLPVRWADTVAAAVAAGAASAIDAGPGDTLVRLARFLPQLPTATA